MTVESSRVIVGDDGAGCKGPATHIILTSLAHWPGKLDRIAQLILDE